MSRHHGIAELWRESLGDPRVCIAVIDGPVDLSHRCFEGADLTELQRPVDEKPGLMAAHGTHVASLIFGQPGSPVQGIAPRCRGLLIPVFSERRRKVSQLSLASAISLAAEHGADIINISGGQLTYFGESEDLLAHAIEAALKMNVLVIAAAGNDRKPRNREECLHVPAALPSVLTVGGMDEDGSPLASNCWAPVYAEDGVLALGKDVLGAVPTGDRVHRFTGTSFAAPIVSGVAGLLLSLQLKRGERMNPHRVRSALLASAKPCDCRLVKDCRPYMAGELDGVNANKLLSEEGKMSDPRESFVIAQGELEDAGAPPGSMGVEAPAVEVQSSAPEARVEIPAYSAPQARAEMPVYSAPPQVAPSAAPLASPGVTPSGGCGCGGNGSGLVFFIGLVGYDFGTEARRDTFKQQMPPAWYRKTDAGEEFRYLEEMDEGATDGMVQDGYVPIPSNPYDARQMVAYLKLRPSEAASLIWTLNLELTPVYSVQPVGSFADRVYEILVAMLDGQSQSATEAAYVERVSVPAVLSGETVRLFSGQEVAELWVDAPRGMYSWRTTDLLSRARPIIEEQLAARADRRQAAGLPPEQSEASDQLVREVLNKLYYEYRNLGVTSPDRALNYAATNIFSLSRVLAQALGDGKSLDRIDVVKSPYGRVDGDCWDVMLKFLDPENTNRAYSVFRYTLDVSDKLPVTMGPVVGYMSST